MIPASLLGTMAVMGVMAYTRDLNGQKHASELKLELTETILCGRLEMPEAFSSRQRLFRNHHHLIWPAAPPLSDPDGATAQRPPWAWI